MVTFVKGKPEKFIAQRDFSLNFEDRNIKSIKIKAGDTILYDGEIVTYFSGKSRIDGPCPNLRAAINRLGWLKKSDEKVNIKAQRRIAKTRKDFSEKIGGNFGTYVKESLNKDKGMEVIDYRDRVVKEIIKKARPKNVEKDSHIIEQKPVRESLTINSSTSAVKVQKHDVKVMKAENAGAQLVIPLKTQKTAEKKEKSKSYVVDANTPKIHEDAKLDEVKRAIETVDAVSGQEGVVVRKIGKNVEVAEVEGIKMKKTESKEKPVTVSVGSGENVNNVGVKVIKGNEKLPVIKPEVAEINKVSTSDSKDYLSMLPDDWAEMHWTKKEKFIMNLTDLGFIEFIQSVETLKAVLNACKERLKQLTKASD